MIEAKVIKDSMSNAGIRIVTMELTYPRFIHQEFLTHRVFSRNSASSRAIPVKKMIENIRNNPAMPVHWGENQPGMQANKEIDNVDLAKKLWIESAELACQQAEKMLELNIHKQIANRLTEPFMHMKTIVTATEWENFFTLRDHNDAQPEIRELAIQMNNAMKESTPSTMKSGDWHLPYVRDDEQHLLTETKLKISTARCARVSYLTHDGKVPDIDKDLELYHRLVISKPPHLSPVEHQATPMLDHITWSGNFKGWLQHRKLIEEN